MKNLFALLLMTCLTLACKRQQGSVDIPKKLKTTMAAFLRQKAGPDSVAVKFDVKEVTYFEDVDFYECEFIVHMISQSTDTTGVMRARIAKDFATVTRKL